ncbi:hypothetical protein C1645_818468 [Glomus cerebriforme]|uniref:Uncharacterized protein n=1 Tax=Glomus cerebriforme TaxID=658196 RepID=A0A397T7C0_9GLOM|nr:hypothetical protein C1645_818468 [Glomus cerebriforme]
MSAIQVWEHILKWGIAQNPELPSDPASYSKDDFNTLKNTLQQLYSYKKIIPKEPEQRLLEKLVQKSIDSKIITFQCAELISKWIDKSEISNKTYEFKLIFHGSLLVKIVLYSQMRIRIVLKIITYYDPNYGPAFETDDTFSVKEYEIFQIMEE